MDLAFPQHVHRALAAVFRRGRASHHLLLHGRVRPRRPGAATAGPRSACWRPSHGCATVRRCSSSWRRWAAEADSDIVGSPNSFGRSSSTSFPAGFRGNWKASATSSLRNWCANSSSGPLAFRRPAGYIVFKRWDALDAAADVPEVVIFFARPDVLSGLFTLANFGQVTVHGVVTPFAAGCGSIVQYPYLERDAENPRAFVGMFDVSARPYVPSDVLTFAVPMRKFASMVANMEESFLITPSWEKVRQRLA